MDFKQESLTDKNILPSSSVHLNILEMVENNNLKEADEGLTVIYDNERKFKELRESKNKKKLLSFSPF